MVKYDPLKRIFLEKFLYVGTKLSTNLRSYCASIFFINISAKFRLDWTTGTCIYPRFLIFGMYSISSTKEPDFPQTLGPIELLFSWLRFLPNFGSLRPQELVIFENITWHFRLVEQTSGWSKFKNFCSYVGIL